MGRCAHARRNQSTTQRQDDVPTSVQPALANSQKGFIAVLFPEDYIKENHPRLVIERLIEHVADADANAPHLFLSPVLRGPCSLGIDQVLIRGPMEEYSLGNAGEMMMRALVTFSEALAHVVGFDMDEAERSRVAGMVLDERQVFHIGMLTREMWDAARAVHAAGADAASD